MFAGTLFTLTRPQKRVKATGGQAFLGVTVCERVVRHRESLGCSRLRPFGRVPIHAGEAGRLLRRKNLSIPKYALDILVCPLCKTRVELLPDESGLRCVTCRRIYPIRDEIPVMLPEEAKIEDAAKQS